MQVLEEREKDYGNYEDLAERHQKILNMLVERMPLPMAIAPPLWLSMHMIVLKLLRLAHSPRSLDSWRDIAGYAELAARYLEKETK